MTEEDFRVLLLARYSDFDHAVNFVSHRGRRGHGGPRADEDADVVRRQRDEPPLHLRSTDLQVVLTEAARIAEVELVLHEAGGAHGLLGRPQLHLPASVRPARPQPYPHGTEPLLATLGAGQGLRLAQLHPLEALAQRGADHLNLDLAIPVGGECNRVAQPAPPGQTGLYRVATAFEVGGRDRLAERDSASPTNLQLAIDHLDGDGHTEELAARLQQQSYVKRRH